MDDGTSVLIVDDDKLIGQIISRILIQRGHRVQFLESSVEALELIKEGLRPALALLDVFMPQMNGAQLGKHIKGLTQIPVVMMTGDVEGSEKLLDDEGLELPLLRKPFAKDVLIEFIEGNMQPRQI